MPDVQETLNKLPEMVYVRDLAEPRWINLITRGEAGYLPVFEVIVAGRAANTPAEMNATLDPVPTPQQIIAMEAGSMFGWHVPLANPDNIAGESARKLLEDREMKARHLTYKFGPPPPRVLEGTANPGDTLDKRTEARKAALLKKLVTSSAPLELVDRLASNLKGSKPREPRDAHDSPHVQIWRQWVADCHEVGAALGFGDPSSIHQGNWLELCGGPPRKARKTKPRDQ